MSDAAKILAAGGYVPTTAKLAPADAAATDVVVARAYHHAALPGRTIVRLTAEALAVGDDLEMAALGCGPGQPRGDVARERRQPLGFPGWALVHDPKHARYALDVVKELKKHLRHARSRPGHAKDGVDELAARLARTAPHFLPSFYEEAGRAFIEHGSPAVAATLFSKAREAEAVHALAIDEQHRVDAFLEFALAGAVSTKALAQYAKELGDHLAPAEAYAHFRKLCVQRTLGGMPPWSGMAKELRRLAKAAGLDANTEDAAVIAEIVESPALAKAGLELWQAYEAPLVRLAAARPAVQAVLLNLFPTGPAYSAALDTAWLGLLDATGAMRALVSDDAPPEVRATGGRAAWFDKLLAHLARGWRAEPTAHPLVLLRRMAASLIRDGAPIHAATRHSRVDLDVLELALELGVPVAPPTEPYANIDVSTWAASTQLPERGRDPVLSVAHPVFGPMLAKAVAEEIGSEPFDGAARGKPGLLAAKRAWLDGVIAQAERGGLPGLETALRVIAKRVPAAAFAELPDLHARFAAIDVAPALARTLQVGILDEFGWPALDAAVAELAAGGAAVEIHGGPPAAIAATATRAIAVSPTARLAAHDLVVPKDHEVRALRFIGGEFLVLLKGTDYRVRAYWSRAPRDVFETDCSDWSARPRVDRAAVLDDGAWIEDTKPIRAGDRALAIGDDLVASDGTTSWTREWKDGVLRWRELTAAGKPGRLSWPPFIDGTALPSGAGQGLAPAGHGWLEGDWRVDPASHVLPAPGGVTRSPLGVADGRVGVRARVRSEPVAGAIIAVTGWRGARGHADRELERIDGVAWRSPARSAAAAGSAEPGATDVVHLLTVPGDPAARPVVFGGARDAPNEIFDPTGRFAGSRLDAELRYARGQPAALSPGFWHAMEPRDPSGSQRLRAITADEARALIHAAAQLPAQPSVRGKPAPAVDVIGDLLPLTSPALRIGVSSIAVLAVESAREHARLATERAPDRALLTTPGHSDDLLMTALAGWTPVDYQRDGAAWQQIAHTGQHWRSADRSDRVVADLPASVLDWLPLAVARWSLAYLATAIGVPPAARRALVDLLAHMNAVLPPAEHLRYYRIEESLDSKRREREFALHWRGGNGYAIRSPDGSWTKARHVLEYAPDGRFVALRTITHELCGTTAPADEEIAALRAVVARGETSWSPERPGRLSAATGMTPAEAAFVLAGCPNAHDRRANFLDKALREQLGLKTTQAALARDGIITTPLWKRIAMIDEAARAGVAALVDGRATDALATAYIRVVGQRVAVPEALVAAADRELATPMRPAEALAMIAAADRDPRLNVDGIWALDREGNAIRSTATEPQVQRAVNAVEGPRGSLDDAPGAFDATVMQTVGPYVAFLFAELPVGDALRTAAATAHERALARLANPALWVPAGWGHVYLPDDATRVRQLIATNGGDDLTGLAEPATGRLVRGAAIILSGYEVKLQLRPAQYDAKAATLVRPIAELLYDRGPGLRALEALRAPDLAALVARIRATPVPEGGYEQNALLSAPALVDRVARARDLSRDAAALYLQFLVLLWPTPKNLQRWNGWTAKQLDAATAELVAHDLVLEAKRERAQRSHFLPGAWDADKPPHPPRERWKLPLYRTVEPGGTGGEPGATGLAFGRYLAIAPFHVLFERAWQRIEAGDVPRYEEVQR